MGASKLFLAPGAIYPLYAPEWVK